MKTKAELFQETLPDDETNVVGVITKILDDPNGRQWGKNAFKVEFDDNSYYSAAIFFPQDELCYFNGSAKVNVNE